MGANFVALRSGDFVQDLVGPGGVLFGKVLHIFRDHGTASYAGPGSGRGSNFIYSHSRNSFPQGPRQDQEAQWVVEQRDLLSKWKAWGMSKILLGSRQRELDLFMIEFSLCDYQRAIR